MNTPSIEDILAQLDMMNVSEQNVQPTSLPFNTQDGHYSNMCPYSQEEMEGYYWPNQWNYEQQQDYQWWDNNQVWGHNQNQAWGNDQYQQIPQIQQPYHYPPQQTEMSITSLEDIVLSLAISTQIFQDTTRESLKSIEQQLEPLTQSVRRMEIQSQLPSGENPWCTTYATPLKDEKSFEDQKVLYEEEEEVDVEEVVEEEEQIEDAVKEDVEQVLEVNKIEIKPPTTDEKLNPLEDQQQQQQNPEKSNLRDPSKDAQPEKEDAQPIINSTTFIKMEELTTLLNRYNKRLGWIVVVIKGLNPAWFPRKMKVKYKVRVPFEEVVQGLLYWIAPHT